MTGALRTDSLRQQAPKCIGASCDSLLEFSLAGYPAKAYLSPTDIVRSVHVSDMEVLDLRAYRDGYNVHDAALQELGIPQLDKDAILQEAYASAGVDPSVAQRMIERFWRPQVLPNMILPDAKLGWRVVVPVAEGCYRSCEGCPAQNSFKMPRQEGIDRAMGRLSKALYETHTSKLPSAGLLNIEDETFFYKNKSGVQFGNVMRSAQRCFPSIIDWATFIGTATGMNLYRKELGLLQELVSPMHILYNGLEIMPPFNSFIFHKDDKTEDIVDLPSKLRSLNPDVKVIAIVQLGFSGDGIYHPKLGFRSTEELIEGTAQLIKDAGYDGVRISEHIELEHMTQRNRMQELRDGGVIVGKSDAKKHIGQMVSALHRLGIPDVDTSYAFAISEFDRELAARNAEEADAAPELVALSSQARNNL